MMFAPCVSAVFTLMESEEATSLAAFPFRQKLDDFPLARREPVSQRFGNFRLRCGLREKLVSITSVARGVKKGLWFARVSTAITRSLSRIGLHDISAHSRLDDIPDQLVGIMDRPGCRDFRGPSDFSYPLRGVNAIQIRHADVQYHDIRLQLLPLSRQPHGPYALPPQTSHPARDLKQAISHPGASDRDHPQSVSADSSYSSPRIVQETARALLERNDRPWTKYQPSESQLGTASIHDSLIAICTIEKRIKFHSCHERGTGWKSPVFPFDVANASRNRIVGPKVTRKLLPSPTVKIDFIAYVHAQTNWFPKKPRHRLRRRSYDSGLIFPFRRWLKPLKRSGRTRAHFHFDLNVGSDVQNAPHCSPWQLPLDTCLAMDSRIWRRAPGEANNHGRLRKISGFWQLLAWLARS